MCNDPVRNKWIVNKICGKAIEDGEIQDAMMQDGKKAKMHKKLQRYSDPHQGDVCFHKFWPEIKTWRCPKGCTMVEDKAPPFCQNKDGDACRTPLPGGGPGEETGGNSSLPLL